MPAPVMQPLQQALLCYTIPADKCEAMSNCLNTLATELGSASLNPGNFSTHGLAINGSDLAYSVDDRFKQFTGAEESSVTVMHNLDADTDPSPLLLIYTDDDSPDDNHRSRYRKILLERLVARLVCEANLLPVGQTYAITPRELAIKTTDDIFQYLASDKQTSMERFIRKNIFGRISFFWKDKPLTPVKLDNRTLQISYKDNLAKAEFLDWLEDAKRTNFNDEKVDEKQMLFSIVESSVQNTNPATN